MTDLGSPNSILITGASSGIGKALALRYARPSVTLFISGRNKERLTEVACLCAEKGADVRDKVIDVTDCDAMNEWMIEANKDKEIDLVIANAGISGGTGGSKSGESSQQANDIFNINVNGLLHTIYPLLPSMIERGRGQIAIMSSLASFSAWPGAPAYSASKAAVRFYGEALRGAMLSKGVKINVICPGFIETPMTAVNNYKMPFMIDADESARIIMEGLAKNKGRIAFPWQTYMISKALSFIPSALSIRLLSMMPEKPASEV
jgi:short-subunit dehydrogenase